MRRRFNYTGRQRIEQADVMIVVTEGTNGSLPIFDAEVDLGEYGLPDEASLIIEAYERREYQRFAFGSVAAAVPPMDRTLKAFPLLDLVKFRVKVIDTVDRPGRILAVADRLKPEHAVEKKKRSLLPVAWRRDMGEAVWRVNVDAASQPVIEINQSIPEIQDLVHADKRFGALVWPAVLRDILNYLLFGDGGYEPGAGAEWKDQWLRFVSQFHRMSPPASDDLDSLLEWRDDAVEAFCDRVRPRAAFIEEGGR